MRNFNRKKRLLCLLLALLVCAAGWALPALAAPTARAAQTPTSLGLAEHGIKAFNDGWIYVSGAKGDTYGDTRASDCAGLIYAYFSDLNALGDCRGGATSQVTYNCLFSNDISEGIPNIHGLVLTAPDYYDPGTGIYGHIGIYIGNNEATDNSSTNVNMLRGPVVGSDRSWTAWHLFDNGMKYPVNGWYAFDGKMVHYTDYEYDVNTIIDGYFIGSDGFAQTSSGQPAPIDPAMLSQSYAPASLAAAHLRTKYSGQDSTYELIYGAKEPDNSETPNYSGKIIGDGVRLRESSNTKSAVLATLSKGTMLDILEEEKGESISHGTQKTDLWYLVATAQGQTGYICSLFVERLSPGLLTAPEITASGGYVTMATGAPNADIFYTTDGTQPDGTSTPYVGPLFLTGHTYKAVAIHSGRKSGVSTATVLSDSSVFTDFTSDAWYFDAVDQAVSAQIFRGNGDGTFSPKAKITRGQFVLALANLDRVDLELFTSPAPFTDVDGSSQMSKAITWAVDTGIVSGFSDGTFKPASSITREEMCSILARYAGLERSESSVPFADDQKISGWAKDAVYACRDNDLVSGVGNNLFDPKGTATRAQACVLTVNLYQR